MSEENYKIILENLKNKAYLKQQIFKITEGFFQDFKEVIAGIAEKLGKDVEKDTELVKIEYKEINEFEVRLKFSGDTLIFTMHTNVFYINPNNFVHKTDYVKSNPARAYCGVIHIHNFLSDSIKYNRVNDKGYLVGRVFINSEKCFFAEGKGQLGFLFESFGQSQLDKQIIESLVQVAMNETIEFELYTPEFAQIQSITLENKLLTYSNSGVQTDKSIGYKFSDQLEGES